MLEFDCEEIAVEDIKKHYSETADIEFVSYSNYDAVCNLCWGTLTLKINGEDITFGRDGMFSEFFSPGECWSSEGERKRDSNSKGWDVDVKELPEKYRPYAKQIHDILNQYMPKDFCVGCD